MFCGGHGVRRAPCRQHGFTLVELTMVLIVLGILATLAMGRFFDDSVFAARGYADAAAGLLRYAQKLAVARHGNVSVLIDDAGLSLCATASSPCRPAHQLPGPDGERPYRIELPARVRQVASATHLSFDAQGRPAAQFTLEVHATSVHTVQVEAETGYVY